MEAIKLYKPCTHPKCVGRLRVQWPPVNFCPHCGRRVEGPPGGAAQRRETMRYLARGYRATAEQVGGRKTAEGRYNLRRAEEFERYAREWTEFHERTIDEILANIRRKRAAERLAAAAGGF